MQPQWINFLHCNSHRRWVTKIENMQTRRAHYDWINIRETIGTSHNQYLYMLYLSWLLRNRFSSIKLEVTMSMLKLLLIVGFTIIRSTIVNGVVACIWKSGRCKMASRVSAVSHKASQQRITGECSGHPLFCPWVHVQVSDMCTHRVVTMIVTRSYEAIAFFQVIQNSNSVRVSLLWNIVFLLFGFCLTETCPLCCKDMSHLLTVAY